MVKTLAEIKVDTEPDESADYWQERHQIDGWNKTIKQKKKDLETLSKQIDKKS